MSYKLRAFGVEGSTSSPRRYIAVERYVSRLIVIKRSNDQKAAARAARQFHETTGRKTAVIDQHTGAVVLRWEAD